MSTLEPFASHKTQSTKQWESPVDEKQKPEQVLTYGNKTQHHEEHEWLLASSQVEPFQHFCGEIGVYCRVHGKLDEDTRIILMKADPKRVCELWTEFCSRYKRKGYCCLRHLEEVEDSEEPTRPTP